MQSHSSYLLRAKALSVFRACMEQMEMYKDTSAYQGIVKEYIQRHLTPWILALQTNISVDLTSTDDCTDIVKLVHACYKVLSYIMKLM